MGRALPEHVTRTETGWLTHNVSVSWSQLHSPDYESWPPLLETRLIHLLNEYGWVCELAGAAFPVHMGYRSRRYQQTFHPPAKKDHVYGYALDILPLPDWTPARMAVYAQKRWRMTDSVLWGIGIYTNWLHIDIRPRKRPFMWHGSAGRPE